MTFTLPTFIDLQTTSHSRFQESSVRERQIPNAGVRGSRHWEMMQHPIVMRAIWEHGCKCRVTQKFKVFRFDGDTQGPSLEPVLFLLLMIIHAVVAVYDFMA
ncbi:hypothetical protein J6590_006666 [Homalodisca vitripennis]|nr:hypothetical protein J6590_006666 [Homalodisca vitripennis]